MEKKSGERKKGGETIPRQYNVRRILCNVAGVRLEFDLGRGKVTKKKGIGSSSAH